MSDRHDPPREERYAKALRLAEQYRHQRAAGMAAPLEQFLLAHADVRRQLEPLLADATVFPSVPLPPVSAAKAPATVGPYRILSRLGAGGMGTVYLAERNDPEQRVALKVIRSGLDSAALVAHFQHERAALAKMNHDAIAKVFDAGTTAHGEPYFVMELVEHGTPLTAYCDARALSIAERIRLFQQVCDGVQHAHRKGVVHRDLKPGNVLVAPQGERHGVKIIDFGIAGPAVSEAGTSASAQRPVGTPEYMSPEQATGDPQLIDSRTDVYSLGVLLYELLTGELPFASDELRELPTVLLQERLRDSEPQRPSTKITTSGDKATRSALARGMSVAALAKTVRGDLDWIVLKAIAKNPEQRYATPHDLALDLRRYLSHEPVLAVPTKLFYRARKAMVRHRLAVAAGIGIGAILVSAAVAVGARGSTFAAEKGLQAEIAAQRRSGLLADWNKLRRPDLIAGETLDVEAGCQAYEAALLARGVHSFDRGLRELFADAIEDRMVLLDELYWLQLTLSRRPPAPGGTTGERLTQALIDDWLRSWEHRPWRLDAWRAFLRDRAGEKGPLAGFANTDAAAVNIDDLEWLTLLLSFTGHNDRLRELLERVNDLDNDRWWIRFRLATLTDGTERLMHAAAAVALANQRTATWYNYAWNFQFIKEPPFGNPEEAVRGYRKAIYLDPTNWRAYLNLTYLIAPEEGVTLMREALQQVPHPDLYHRLAERLREVKRCDESVEVSRRAIDLYPDHAGVHAILGECLGWLERYEEAIAPLERALDLAPSDQATRRNLLECLSETAHHAQDPDRRRELQKRQFQVLLGGPKQPK